MVHDPARAVEQAEALFRDGNEPAAVLHLQQHLDDPACALRLREWAVAERRLDLLPAALAALDRVGGPEAEVGRAVHAQAGGDPSAALALLKPVTGAHPDLPSAHHHAGRALHNLGRRAEALAALRVAVRLDHEYSEAWYSLAHALRASGRMEEAVAAYRTALARRPGFRAALLNLGITLCAAERPEEALPPLQHLTEIDPQSVEGWINQGLCLHLLGRAAESNECYLRALALDPAHPTAHFYLGSLLNEHMDGDGARGHLEAALRGAPGDPDVLAELAGLLEQENALEQAAARVQEGLAAAPGHPGLVLESARLARRRGDAAAARQALMGLDPAALPARAAQQLWFERALVHDRCEEPDQAMQALEQAHALAARSPRRRAIDREAFPRRIAALRAWLERGAPGATAQPGDPPAALPFRPAFLVGFPRSGTTLLDTMLDAHPDVASVEERATLEAVSEAMPPDGAVFPDGMQRLGPGELEEARGRYRDAVGPWVPAGFSGLVLDKLPLRLLRVPLIHRLLPEAPILFSVRHPCDVVLSNTMQQYRPNEAFVHFDSLEQSVRTYDAVMQCWRGICERLPLRLHQVRYERLVAEPDTELRAACAALAIELHPDMLDAGRRLEGRGRVQTTSYQQVAEPLYQRAAGRWHAYRQWLDPHLPVLRPWIDWFGYPQP